MAYEFENYLSAERITEAAKSFHNADPFDYCIVDDFFNAETAAELAREFPDFNDEVWHEYNNPIEIKKVSNNWNQFGPLTYRIMNILNGADFVNFLGKTLKISPMYSDSGLNGGGWHIHRAGGKLNTHLDYSIHPKMNHQRKINIIMYMNPNWQESWGGTLGLWRSSEDGTKPTDLVKSVWPKFNRAIIFDTTQQSWHGLPEPVACPETEYRKSLAIYYLTDAPAAVDPRGKALFAPTKEQENDKDVLDLIRKRADVKTASEVYKK